MSFLMEPSWPKVKWTERVAVLMLSCVAVTSSVCSVCFFSTCETRHTGRALMLQSSLFFVHSFTVS